VKYDFVENHRQQYGVPALCEALQSRAAATTLRDTAVPSDRQKRRADLTARIRAIHEATESYGAPGVQGELPVQKGPCYPQYRGQGEAPSGNPAQGDPRFRVCTDARKTKASPNLIRRDSTSARPNVSARPNFSG